jgi:hypothetical protein
MTQNEKQQLIEIIQDIKKLNKKLEELKDFTELLLLSLFWEWMPLTTKVCLMPVCETFREGWISSPRQ